MFPERLRELRTSRKMSRRALADLFGITETAVYNWENGLSEPGMDKLRTLADFFGVTLDDLCGRCASPTENEVLMTRAFSQLTPAEQEQVLAVTRILFDHAFRGGMEGQHE